MKWGMVLTPEAKENLKLLEPAYEAVKKYCDVIRENEGCSENCPLNGASSGLYFGNADDDMGTCLCEVLKNFTKNFHCDTIDEDDNIIEDNE